MPGWRRNIQGQDGRDRARIRGEGSTLQDVHRPAQRLLLRLAQHGHGHGAGRVRHLPRRRRHDRGRLAPASPRQNRRPPRRRPLPLRHPGPQRHHRQGREPARQLPRGFQRRADRARSGPVHVAAPEGSLPHAAADRISAAVSGRGEPQVHPRPAPAGQRVHPPRALPRQTGRPAPRAFLPVPHPGEFRVGVRCESRRLSQGLRHHHPVASELPRHPFEKAGVRSAPFFLLGTAVARLAVLFLVRSPQHAESPAPATSPNASTAL